MLHDQPVRAVTGTVYAGLYLIDQLRSFFLRHILDVRGARGNFLGQLVGLCLGRTGKIIGALFQVSGYILQLVLHLARHHYGFADHSAYLPGALFQQIAVVAFVWRGGGIHIGVRRI